MVLKSFLEQLNHNTAYLYTGILLCKIIILYFYNFSSVTAATEVIDFTYYITYIKMYCQGILVNYTFSIKIYKLTAGINLTRLYGL